MQFVETKKTNRVIGEQISFHFAHYSVSFTEAEYIEHKHSTKTLE